MDILCPVCGEPWDHDELHEEAARRYNIPYGHPNYDGEKYNAVFKKVSAAFRKHGCEVFGADCSESKGDKDRANAAAEIYSILGDDLDGAASAFDDFGLT